MYIIQIKFILYSLLVYGSIIFAIIVLDYYHLFSYWQDSSYIRRNWIKIILNIEYYGKLQKTKIYQQLELFKILKRSTFYKISMKQETYEDLNHYNKFLKNRL